MSCLFVVPAQFPLQINPFFIVSSFPGRYLQIVDIDARTRVCPTACTWGIASIWTIHKRAQTSQVMQSRNDSISRHNPSFGLLYVYRSYLTTSPLPWHAILQCCYVRPRQFLVQSDHQNLVLRRNKCVACAK